MLYDLMCVLVLCRIGTAHDYIINIKVPDNVPKDSVIGNILENRNITPPKTPYNVIVGANSFVKFYDYFHITKAGDVIVKKFLDRDSIPEICGPLSCCSKEICDFYSNVIFTSIDTKTVWNFRINFEIIDDNDNAPQFAKSTFTIDVQEEHNQYRMSLPTAYDLDSSVNGVYNYSLAGTINYEKFRLSCDNGYPELILLSSLDYEDPNQREILLSLTAYDRGNRSESMSIIILTIDINDNRPLFRNDTYIVNVLENTTYRNSIATVKATDKDSGDNGHVLYKIVNLDVILDTVILNERTGEISLSRLLDYENFNDQRLEIEIQACDQGSPQLSSSTKVIINTNDINDNAPTIEVVKNVTLPENQRLDTPILSLYVHDSDNVFNDVSCYKVAGRDFRIDTSQKYSVTVYVDGHYDYENCSSIFMDLHCSDSGMPPMSVERRLYVAISDENDNLPLFTRSLYEFEVFEDAKVGELLFKVAANDRDFGKFGEVTYRIEPEARAFFSLNTSSGDMHLASELDRESRDRIEFSVFASDSGGLESRAGVVVTVLDTNDNAPMLRSAEQFRVAENLPPNSLVGQIKVFDPDSAENGQVSVEIENEEQAYFADHLRYRSGSIVTNSAIDREKVSRIFVKLKLVDGGRPRLTSWHTITVHVLDENDNDPRLNYPLNGSVVRLVRGLHVMTRQHNFVVTLQGEDRDALENGQVRYFLRSVSNGSRLFRVNETSGAVQTVWSCSAERPLSCPRAGLYRLDVELADRGREPRRARFHFFLAVKQHRGPSGSGLEDGSDVTGEQAAAVAGVGIFYYKNALVLALVIVFSLVLAVGLVGAIVWARTRPPRAGGPQHTGSNGVSRHLAVVCGHTGNNKENSGFLADKYSAASMDRLAPSATMLGPPESRFLGGTSAAIGGGDCGPGERSCFTSFAPPPPPPYGGPDLMGSDGSVGGGGKAFCRFEDETLSCCQVRSGFIWDRTKYPKKGSKITLWFSKHI